MQVKDIMTKKPQFIHPETTLLEAAQLMNQQDFGFLPIGEDDKLVGMVTDRDLTIRGTAQGFDPKITPVNKVMTQKVLYVFETDDVEDALKNMQEQQIRRLIVLNDKTNKRMTGIISLGDCAKKSGNDESCGETLEKICSS